MLNDFKVVCFPIISLNRIVMGLSEILWACFDEQRVEILTGIKERCDLDQLGEIGEFTTAHMGTSMPWHSG